MDPRTPERPDRLGATVGARIATSRPAGATGPGTLAGTAR